MEDRAARVLVVDDSSTIRLALTRFLKAKGLEARAIGSGQEALETLAEESFDLVILDVVMNGMDGLTVLEHIRQTRSKLELPVLMATSRSGSSDVVRALKLGANDYVTKPLDLEVTFARIESQLAVRAQAATTVSQHARLQPDGSVPIGTILDGRYHLLERLGFGGFAVVYKARQVTTGQTVAVKLLRAHRATTPGRADEELERFRREMSLIGELQHPHIVRLIDSGWLNVKGRTVRPPPKDSVPPTGQTATQTLHPDDTLSDSRMTRTPVIAEISTRVPFIVMEYLEGESLDQLLKREGPLSAARATGILLPVASALMAAHAKGAVHRDMKPGNIFLSAGHDGSTRVTVLDFGVAKLVEADGELTDSEALVVTPGYWSPEQARGTSEVDDRSDQYTLGTILYECVTAKKAFPGKGLVLVHKIAEGRFDPPSFRIPTLPRGFEAVILRAMSSEPDDRFPTLAAFARALLPFADEAMRGRWAGAFAQAV